MPTISSGDTSWKGLCWFQYGWDFFVLSPSALTPSKLERQVLRARFFGGLISILAAVRCGNRTRDGLVSSANASSLLCRPPSNMAKVAWYRWQSWLSCLSCSAKWAVHGSTRSGTGNRIHLLLSLYEPCAFYICISVSSGHQKTNTLTLLSAYLCTFQAEQPDLGFLRYNNPAAEGFESVLKTL